MAIDQPIDLTIPESSVMLAVYLSVPEAENTRRALNTANGIRRAKQMGRYPNKAPLGYINLTALDGKKLIVPKQLEANIIRWVFQQLSKNINKMEEVRRMAIAKGLKCSKSYFSKFIRNPAYCGLIPIKINDNERQMVKGIHEPLISQALFYDVQAIINAKKIIVSKTDELRTTFFLKGFLVCPICGRKLTGSFSSGSVKKYPYYHCPRKCKTRINAEVVNNLYKLKLQKLLLSNKVKELFNCILEDSNTGLQKGECLQERRMVLIQIEQQLSTLSKARKLLVADVLKFDDYSELKKECKANLECLNKELDEITTKIKHIDRQRHLRGISFVNIFQGYENFDTADKIRVANLIPPVRLDHQTGDFSLDISNALSKILLLKR
jgi:hypothetical protein